MNVTILGLGEIGGALYNVLKKKRNVTIRTWDKNASKIPNQGTLGETLQGCDVLFICVPSWTLRAAVLSIAPHLAPHTIVISLSKGIEKETCKTADALLTEHLPGQAVGVLGGPMLAEELSAGRFTVGVLGSTHSNTRKIAKKLFKNTPIAIATTRDMKGVSFCGVLKNTYTLIVGIGEGLSLGENAKGALVSGALSEMRQLVKKFGGKDKTTLGPAGIGDFFATSTSQQSQNRTLGIAIGQNQEIEIASEGLMSLHCLKSMTTNDLDRYPLLAYLFDVTEKKIEASSITSYLSRMNV